MHLVLLALSLTANADPTCAGPIELRTFNVPVTTCAGGVAVPTTPLGVAALQSSVNGDGGDGALVAGASLLGTLDALTAKVEVCDDACDH